MKPEQDIDTFSIPSFGGGGNGASGENENFVWAFLGGGCMGSGGGRNGMKAEAPPAETQQSK